MASASSFGSTATTNTGTSSFSFGQNTNSFGAQQQKTPTFGQTATAGFGGTTGGFGTNTFGAMQPAQNNMFGAAAKPAFGAAGTSGFDRQMSVPSNLADQGRMNGFAQQHKSGFGGPSDRGYGGGGNNSENVYSGFNRSSPPQQRSGFNDMKIGTWNEGSSGSGANGQGGQGMNGANGGPGGQGGAGGGNYPNMGTFEIGTFNIQSNNGQSGSSSRHNGYNNDQQGPPGPGHRETGIIEKLLHSYGFIQCCDRQARLFFHFSQFDGNIEHLKIGDPVEFEMTYDRRTGKPIASSVSKIAPEVVMREERVVGTVTTEARVDPETGGDTQGRISYENRGECFFLPFTQKDVEGNVTVSSGDKVSFQIATMARSGNLVARTIRLENPAAPVKYQGVVNSIQEDKSFGFIERADVVREIFFRNTDLEDGVTIDLGKILQIVLFRNLSRGKNRAPDFAEENC